MYRWAVGMMVRRRLAGLSRGDFEPIARSFGADGRLQMLGEHALGEERRGPDAVRAWFHETLELFPGLRVTPRDVVVAGWPWSTRVCTRFDVHAELPDGTPYRNAGMQYLRLRWGRVVEDLLYEDTQALAAAIERVRAPA